MCHKCQQPYTEKDVVILNAEDEDLEKMQNNMLERKASKKGKKRSRIEETATGETKPENGTKKKTIKKEEKGESSKEKNRRIEAEDPDYKRSKKDYSIAKDPKASEVLKSIFTSHKSATEQTRAHWVTYNPFYN